MCSQKIMHSSYCTTVDGWNPANQLIDGLILLFTVFSFIHPRWCRISAINSMDGLVLKLILTFCWHHLFFQGSHRFIGHLGRIKAAGPKTELSQRSQWQVVWPQVAGEKIIFNKWDVWIHGDLLTLLYTGCYSLLNIRLKLHGQWYAKCGYAKSDCTPQNLIQNT